MHHVRKTVIFESSSFRRLWVKGPRRSENVFSEMCHLSSVESVLGRTVPQSLPRAPLALRFNAFSLDCFNMFLISRCQMTNGGALYVEKDSSATFMGAARFIGNSVISEDLPSSQTASGGFRSNFKLRSGGAVFNKVIVWICLTVCATRLELDINLCQVC